MEIFRKLKARDVLESSKKETNIQDAVLRECGKISERLGPALLLQQGYRRGNYTSPSITGWVMIN